MLPALRPNRWTSDWRSSYFVF